MTSELERGLAAFNALAEVSAAPDQAHLLALPARDRLLVPAMQGRAVQLSAGDLVAIVDLEGHQVADVWAYRTHRPVEFLSAANTRTIHQRMFPRLGEPFVSNRLAPLLTMVADTSPGAHDLLCSACQQEAYAAAGYPDHPSCESNFRAATAAVGDDFDRAPDPIDLFQHSPVDPDGILHFLDARTAPGDRVIFRAEDDITLVVSACPDDISPANGDRCTSIGIDLLRAAHAQPGAPGPEPARP